MAKERSKNKVRKIITLRNSGDIEFLKQSLERFGGKMIKKLPLVEGYLCEFPSEDDVSLAVRGEPDRLQAEDDLEFKLCWYPGELFFKSFFPFAHLPLSKPMIKPKPYPLFFNKESAGWGLQRIGAPQVWSKLKERRVRIGIIDTGIDYYHPDLSENIKGGICTLDGKHQFMDDYGHGTHVAGIIGSTGRTIGLTGINPYVDFYIVKAFDKKGKGNLSDIIEGLDWLARRQVEIINMSFSTTETNQTFYRVIQYLDRRGIVLVAAAGNDGGSNSVNYPARFPQVIAVSATDKLDRLAAFSSTGPEVDFCAPGVEIPSAWVGGRYEVKSGTSFAAPHLTGTVADLLNYYGSLPPTRIKEIMASGAVKIQKLGQEQQGAGMVELPRIIS
ncbi:MAG: S8 family peptidase [Clostridia bacterium]|jgi:hypothetical protein|nr:S8 family peptidase [Clostridia bacterium]MDD4145496.1 S8 family peptidase [Clostridia bacterium]MDD4665915.1 S8 family peptidase [Clostridia bacterium]